MVRSILRVTGAALFLIVVGFGALILYFLADASNLMTRADDKGWLPPANDAPLSTFETTVAKAKFGETWNVKGFPCRAVALGWWGLVDSKNADVPPVSRMVARDFRYGFSQDFDFWNGPKETTLACLLEGKRSDAALMRLWLAQAFVGHADKDVEAASQRLFGKASSELDAAQAEKLAALVMNPNVQVQAETPDKQTKLTLETPPETTGKKSGR